VTSSAAKAVLVPKASNSAADIFVVNRIDYPLPVWHLSES
jgi:hypothetical protein